MPEKQKINIVKSKDIGCGNNAPKGITFDISSTGNYRINAKKDLYSLHYFIEPKMLFDQKVADAIINATKQMIRTSQIYSAYIAYLRNEIGLRFDAFNGNITQDNASIEMHHGPIFSLEDYVKIILDWQFANDMKVNTFTIAKQVMEEHAMNNVQVAMLSRNNHALVHNGVLNLDFKQCFGNIYAFISKYKQQIAGSLTLTNKIYRYRDQLASQNFYSTQAIQPGTVVDYSQNDDDYSSFV
jgi:hypothetical protein